MARVLLVDDEKVARSLYGDYLTAAGHDVTAVGGAPDAKAALAQKPFEVLVTDLILPESDGMELLLTVGELELAGLPLELGPTITNRFGWIFPEAETIASRSRF